MSEASVNLELRTRTAQPRVGDTVEVGIYAVASGSVDETFLGLEVILSWDETHLELQQAIADGPHAWSFMFGLTDDSQLDGLNDSLLDGNARFEAAAFVAAVADADGLLVATLQFAALSGTELTQIVIEPEFGERSRTQVLAPGNINVTGTLGTASVTIGAASLWAIDVTMPAGSTTEALVRGSIIGLSTFGLTVLLEIVPREGTTGTVTYTLTPDIAQRGDPWPGAGTFSAFDTGDTPFSETVNGSVEENGASAQPTPVSYFGPLSAFPLQSSADAAGVWDLMLTVTAPEGIRVDSSWEDLDTGLAHGTLRIVDAGDGDGDTAIDLRDFAELQVCFTGAADSPDQPAYSLTPELRCVVYDFDGDGDVDDLDFAQFSDAVSGPVQ